MGARRRRTEGTFCRRQRVHEVRACRNSKQDSGPANEIQYDCCAFVVFSRQKDVPVIFDSAPKTSAVL